VSGQLQEPRLDLFAECRYAEQDNYGNGMAMITPYSTTSWAG
jgi:hypothetical protein